MNNIDIIKYAYNTSERISIRQKDRNNNDLQVLSYTDDMVTFLKGTRKIEVPMNDLHINIDYTEKFYRDMYCKSRLGMTFDQLADYIESLYRNDECDEVTQVGYKYGASSAKRLDVTINGMHLIAAMTYGTVTGVRFPDGTRVSHVFSNTSTRWESRIL